MEHKGAGAYVPLYGCVHLGVDNGVQAAAVVVMIVEAMGECLALITVMMVSVGMRGCW